MRNQSMGDFTIESKDHCFFCLDKTPPPQTQVGDDDVGTELTTVHSLQYLSRFLRMDMRKVFLEKGDIPPHLIAKVEMSTLKAHLCGRCVSLNETFSSVCRRLEQIEMELISSLEHIYKRLLEAEGTDQYDKLQNPVEDSRDEWIGKLGILEVLRKEAIRKCFIKFQDTRPRIKLQNMSDGGITKLIQKCKLNSAKKKKSTRKCTADFDSHMDSSGIKIKMEQEDALPDLCHDEPDADHQSDFEFDRVSSPSPPCSEAQMVVKSELTELASVSKFGRRYNPTINKHIEIIKTTGPRPKFRCRICAKLFSDRPNTNRHIKMIHLKEKKFRCGVGVCSKAFSTKQDMERHIMSIHYGIKSNQCHLCSKTFSQAKNLTQHLLVHSGARPHICEVCDRAFSRKHNLKMHRLSVHEGIAHKVQRKHK